MKVLIVDTDWRFVQQVREYLESHAHLVVHQNRAGGAISHARHWQPDLIILAAQAVEPRLVAAFKSLPNRPAILLTENVDRFARAWQAWQQCGDELLMKPVFNIQELHDAIVQALENAAVGKDSRPMAASA